MAQHTPGPWSVPHFSSIHPCSCGYVLSDSQYGAGAVATVHHDNEPGGRHNEPLEIAKANARLIAAAPELLQALHIARSQVALLNRGGDDRVTQDVLDLADAAIAKARGEA